MIALEKGRQNMVSAEDIVQAAYSLLGVKYRPWQPGNSIPMWLDDGPYMDAFLHGGHERALAELRLHLHNVGVMGADLVNFALVANRLYETGGGTGTFRNYLTNTFDFDPDSPGRRGAIALRPYQGPQDDGSIALYVGPHQVIQSIPGEGVTDQYTDKQTYSWASHGYPRYRFTVYGFLRGVRY
jgi:hypothetical protein